MIKHAIKALLVSALFCGAACAGTQTGQVTQIIIRASDGLVYFFVNGTSTDRPACLLSNTYWMIKDENSAAGKRQLAALLAARATGQTITVQGTGTCTRWSNGEDVEALFL